MNIEGFFNSPFACYQKYNREVLIITHVGYSILDIPIFPMWPRDNSTISAQLGLVLRAQAIYLEGLDQPWANLQSLEFAFLCWIQ